MAIASKTGMFQCSDCQAFRGIGTWVDKLGKPLSDRLGNLMLGHQSVPLKNAFQLSLSHERNGEAKRSASAAITLKSSLVRGLSRLLPDSDPRNTRTEGR